MTIEQMKERKKEFGYTNAQIADISGVPLGTVQKIFSGETESPRYDTVRALEKALSMPKVRYEYADPLPEADMLKETEAAYRIKKITVDDFYAMPENWKGELIDGVLYSMSTPRYLHQMLAKLIGRQMDEYVREQKGDCLVLPLPVDTQLDCDEYTMLEPDITVLCDRSLLRKGIIYGAPDLVIEILSPSTRRKDCIIKLKKYMDAGVKEYWTVDPEAERIHVYRMDARVFPEIYNFGDKVPVGIWERRCEVDFAPIREEAAFLMESE